MITASHLFNSLFDIDMQCKMYQKIKIYEYKTCRALKFWHLELANSLRCRVYKDKWTSWPKLPKWQGGRPPPWRIKILIFPLFWRNKIRLGGAAYIYDRPPWRKWSASSMGVWFNYLIRVRNDDQGLNQYLA